jgi:putative flippase GtrA
MLHRLNIKFNKFLRHKFVKYLIVGLVSLAGDYLVFLLAYYLLDWPLSVSVPAGLITGIIVNFSLNKLWAFSSKSTIQANSIKRQLLYYGLLLIVNSVFTYLLVRFLENYSVSASIGKLIATVCIVIWNYLIYNFAIFKPKEPTELI